MKKITNKLEARSVLKRDLRNNDEVVINLNGVNVIMSYDLKNYYGYYHDLTNDYKEDIAFKSNFEEFYEEIQEAIEELQN